MSFRDGIARQPENLAGAAAAVREALAGIDLAPLREGTVVFSGIGASWHALTPAVRTLRAAGRRAFAVPAPALATVGPGVADAYVLVSQSGASTEVLAALERLRGPAGAGAAVYAVSARAGGPLARAVSDCLPLGPLPDTTVSTLSYTATLQTLGLLADAILGRDAGAWDGVPQLVADTLERAGSRAAEIAERFAAVTSLDAVAADDGAGSAGATALLFREALRIPATGEETRQYLHGPLEAAAPGLGAIVFGAERELELARSLVSYGASVCAITAGEVTGPLAGFRLPQAPAVATPILQILPVQLIVAAMAGARGLAVEGLSRQQSDTKARAA